eukprot:5990726-Prorocentrum_lima.AAC.1
MTSSLVGSEMCIRDSFNRDEASAAPLKLTDEEPCGMEAFVEEAVGSKAPVCYTHLTLPTICSV